MHGPTKRIDSMPNTIAKNRVFYCPTHVNWNKILSVYTKLFVNEEGVLGNITVRSVRARNCRPKERETLASEVAHCEVQKLEKSVSFE